jgi:hypothetical protein
MSNEVDKVLEERGENYGSYNIHSIVSEGMMQNLSLASNFGSLPAHLEHTFRLIVDKMTRAANGNWKHRDNLVDIIGYATLSLKELDDSEQFEIRFGD